MISPSSRTSCCLLFQVTSAPSLPVTLYADRKKANGIRHWLSFYPVLPKRRKSAAALSAAVDTTNSQEIAPTLQAEPSQQKHPRQAPAALREGARGRSFSQRSCLPRNPRIVPYVSLREGVRGRVLLYREALSPASSHNFSMTSSKIAAWRAGTSRHSERTETTASLLRMMIES